MRRNEIEDLGENSELRCRWKVAAFGYHPCRMAGSGAAFQLFSLNPVGWLFYYFDPPGMREFLSFIGTHLAPGGSFLGDILGECDAEFRSERHLAWMNRVQRDTADGLQALAAEAGLTVQCLGRIDTFGYARDLNLRSNLLLETRAKATPGKPD